MTTAKDLLSAADLSTTPTAALIQRIRCDTANERAAVLELCDRMELWEWWTQNTNRFSLHLDLTDKKWCVYNGLRWWTGPTPLDAIRAAKERSGE